MSFKNSFIYISGGLITSDYIDRLYQANCPDIDPRTFKTPLYSAPSSRDELEENIKAAFESLLEYWEKIRIRFINDNIDIDITTARNKWLIPLFEMLDFDLEYQKAYLTINNDKNLRFPISHRGWKGENAPVVHTVAPSVDLDNRYEGRGNKSPHDTVQTYLNLGKDLWGIVTNGRKLRILRKFHHPYIRGYIEFDVEAIFETRNLNDFRILYYLAHASRFIPNCDGKCPLEVMYDTCLQAGVSIGKNLHENVLKAIEALANGLLKHADAKYVELLRNDEKERNIFYSEILEIMYRFLFLLFAEQRGMMPGRNTLYLEEYSITHLRQIAERSNLASVNDENTDLWEGLKATFKLLKEGSKELDVPAYNGMLFDDKLTPHLNSMECSNRDLINVIRYITLTNINGVLQRISYTDLGVDELGSIYESLLEYTPYITTKEEEINGTLFPPNTFLLDPKGTVRKDSGSYYTSPALVSRLVDEALMPVLEERIRKAGDNPKEKEAAILSMKVCDPACGSGAFLIAAVNAMGLKLAQIRAGDEYPDVKEVQNTRRDVLSNCIYGVDLNPLAVELAKVSLWIDTFVNDRPLNFLDHHIKCGNSLIGAVKKPQSIPEGAFEAIEGDDRIVARGAKKDNNKIIHGQMDLYELLNEEKDELIEISRKISDINSMPEYSHNDVEEKVKRYSEVINKEEIKKQKFIANLWVYAFFQKYDTDLQPVTTSDLNVARKNLQNISPELILAMNDWLEKSEIRPFHWYLEFPEIFSNDDPGFDCILGNPPWNKIKIQDKEFFAYRAQDISDAPNASARKILIEELKNKNPELYKQYIFFKRKDKSTNKFLKYSGRYPLTAHGDINTYSVFAETDKGLLNSRGRAGIIVPTGIATDDNNKDFFNELVSKKLLMSIYDFENRNAIFQNVHRSYRFSLLIFSGGAGDNNEINSAFFNTTAENIDEDIRRIKLAYEDICLINPNTHTCPTFRSRKDMEIIKKIYKNHPVLIKEDTSGKINPYGIKFMRMFDMSNDSGLFIQKDNVNYDDPAEHGYMPLYEAKLIHQYDHRFATYEGIDGENPRELTDHEEHKMLVPRYYVSRSDIDSKLGEWHNEWLFGYRNITNVTNERTMIASILPLNGVGNSINLLLFDDHKAETAALLLANLNSIVFDYIARQKVGGTNLNHFITKQLSVISPERYYNPAWIGGPSWAEIIIPKVLELTYTAYDVMPFSIDLGYDIEPFKWDSERRFELMRELDAIYACLYGLTYDELEWILDPGYPSETFRVLKEKEMGQYGNYKTKERVLYYYEIYSSGKLAKTSV